MIYAPADLKDSASLIVMAGYSWNWYAGNLWEMNPEVVVGVSVVARPMIPNFTPESTNI